jgi:hypothetical protein
MLKFIRNLIIDKINEQQFEFGTSEDLKETTQAKEQFHYYDYSYPVAISNSNAFLAYHLSYNELYDEFFKQNKEENIIKETFKISQSAFLLVTQGLPYISLLCDIDGLYLKTLFAKRMREYHLNIDLPEKMEVLLEIVSFKDNSLIVRMKIKDIDSCRNVFQLVKEKKEDFLDFINKNERLSNNQTINHIVDEYGEVVDSDENKYYREQQDMTLQMTRNTYLAAYELLLQHLQMGVFIDITDVSSLIEHLIDVKSIKFSTKKKTVFPQYHDLKNDVVKDILLLANELKDNNNCELGVKI